MKTRGSYVFGLAAWCVLGLVGDACAQVALRDLSDFSSTNQPFTVSILVTPPTGTIAFGVEDLTPTGWTNISNIDNNGTWDAVNGKVKWGPYFNDIPVTLHYTITPPADPGGSTPCFSGIVSIDGNNSTIAGSRCLPPPVPTVSDWGLTTTLLLLLIAGTVLIRRRGVHGVHDPLAN